MHILNKLIVIVLISFTFCNTTPFRTREFLSAYFGVIKGNDWHLNDDCFGGQYAEYLDNLYSAMLKLNIVAVYKNLDKMIELEIQKCPVDESVQLYKDFRTAMRNLTLLHNYLRNSSLIKSRIDDFKASNRSMKQFGLCMGYVTNILVYGTPNSSYDPENESNFLKFLQ